MRNITKDYPIMTTPPHKHTKFNYAIKMLQIMRTFVTLQNVANEAHCIRNIDKILIIFPGKGTRGGGTIQWKIP